MLICPQCNKEFFNKANKFCSSSCSATYNNLKRSKKQIKPCLECSKNTTNDKFCSHQCYLNKKQHKKPRYCKGCSKQISIGWINFIYCFDCRQSPNNPNYRDWSNITLETFFNKLPKYQANARIRELSRNIYRKSNKPKQCCACGYSKFYEVCHVKPLKDFDKQTSIYEVNSIDNLIGLCPNCHWEFDHNLLTIEQITGGRIELPSS